MISGVDIRVNPRFPACQDWLRKQRSGGSIFAKGSHSRFGSLQKIFSDVGEHEEKVPKSISGRKVVFHLRGTRGAMETNPSVGFDKATTSYSVLLSVVPDKKSRFEWKKCRSRLRHKMRFISAGQSQSPMADHLCIGSLQKLCDKSFRAL